MSTYPCISTNPWPTYPRVHAHVYLPRVRVLMPTFHACGRPRCYILSRTVACCHMLSHAVTCCYMLLHAVTRMRQARVDAAELLQSAARGARARRLAAARAAKRTVRRAAAVLVRNVRMWRHSSRFKRLQRAARVLQGAARRLIARNRSLGPSALREMYRRRCATVAGALCRCCMKSDDGC